MTSTLALALAIASVVAVVMAVATCRMTQPRVRRRYIKAKPEDVKSQ